MFRELKLLPFYTSDSNDIAREFYNPVLYHAVQFDRTSAYFSAKALARYSEGLEYFGKNNCKYRLIISHEVSQEDYAEIKQGYALRDTVRKDLLQRLDEVMTLEEEKQISNLAFFIAIGTVDIKIAFKPKGIFHDKCGILTDAIGDSICFRGSNNETVAAVDYNYESFQIVCSWHDNSDDNFYTRGIEQSKAEFESLWSNKKEGLVVLPADEVVLKEILNHNKGKVIVENILLKDNALILDYQNEQLVLQFNTDGIDWLVDKTFFKVSLKHKVDRISGNTIYFKPDLVYPDYLSIHKKLEKRIPSLGYEYYATQRLLDYIEQRNIHIQTRAKLGIELKTDPTRIEDRYNLFKQVVNNNFSRQLREKQMKDAFYMCAMIRSGNFSVPGSGKTSSALAVYAYLREKNLVDRVVMIGPKNAFGSWIDEFIACFGDKHKLNLFSIQDTKYSRGEDKRAALKYEAGNCNLFLFNYESINNYIDEIRHIVSSRTLLVFDEVHKVKAINGKQAGAALEISKYANYIIAMTGTPIPNTYLDIYNLLHILYNDEYKEFFGFETNLLRNPLPTDIDYINEKIQPFFCRTTKKQLLVPEPNADILKKVQVSKAEQELFDILRKRYRNNKLALFIRLLQMETNPHLLLQRLDLSDFANILELDGEIEDIDFVDYAIDVKNLISEIGETSKKHECIDLIETLIKQEKKLVVWCIFVDSIISIKHALELKGIKAETVWGEVPLDYRLDIINRFKANEIDVLITNPHTLAESVSLHTVCHDAIYYEYSYNLVHLLQSKDRIHRLGLPENQYTQYYFIQNEYDLFNDVYSLDNEIYERLLLKEQRMLDAIDNQELEPVYTPEEDLDLIFEKLF
ncbi:MAG: DEAD/DEAH box helicase family protein [Pseudobutyrivibrio sp.]|nr:DEAD/DEAH box helicase family protein [Pseudobutyrivibrio sp.]